jgi:outer membrane protein assembly factor BamB
VVHALRDRLRLLASLLFALFVVSGITPLAQGQVAQKPDKSKPYNDGRGASSKRPFRENSTLPMDSSLRKRFDTVKDLLADERWTEAIGILQEIAQTDRKSLVLVKEGVAGGVASSVNVATRCNVLLSRISAQGREAYRQKVDVQAKRWYENWQRSRDESELLRIVRQTFLSSSGDDALLALGELAWDRGDFSAARLWWEQLVPLPEDANPADYPTVLRYPDSKIAQAGIQARIVACSILERETVRATDELRQFRERFPEATGRIGGHEGRLDELLQQILDESAGWTATKPTAEVATFGLSPERFRRIPESVDTGALRWVRPLMPNTLPHQVDGLPFQNEPLGYFPVVYDNFVIVNDSESIRAWNILTGEPAWQSERKEPAVIYPSVGEEPAAPPDKICVGVPFYTMTIADGRLYARMGSPVTCTATTELRRELASDLVCLDLTQEGKLLWKLPAHELIRDDSSWRYEGTPVIVAGRAYVALARRHPQLELMVICLDASDGRLLWQRPVGAFRTSVDDNFNRVSHLLLTAGGGRIFLSTDAGAIVALDAQDGRLEWGVTYETRSDESPAALSDSGRKGLLPGLFHEGLLFVAPNDADSAFCIEVDSGRIRWQFSYLQKTARETSDQYRRERQWRYLLGVAPGGSAGRLIVSGSSLWAIDIETGLVEWQRNKSAFGRGLIAGDQILVPRRESIEIFDLVTGRPDRKIPLKTPEAPQLGGNLTLAGGMLLVAQSNRLAAYCEYSRLKERIERELTRQPDAFNLMIQLAELEAAEGQHDAAAAGFQQVLERVAVDDPACRIARQKLTTMWQEAGRAAFQDAKLAQAREFWQQALTVVDNVSRRVELIFDLARVDESLDQPSAALARLQTILNEERLTSVPRELSTAGHDAGLEMTRLMSIHGRQAYQEIESEASRELDALAELSDRPGLRRLIDKYPHAIITSRARLLLAEMHRRSGQIPEAFAVLSEVRRNALDERTSVDATLAIIELLESAHGARAAVRWWQTLAALPRPIQVVFHGARHDLGELSQSRLQSVDATPQSTPAHLQRSWLYALPVDARVIVPEHEPPSDKVAAILVCSRHDEAANSWLWRCLDWQTGEIRWQETNPSPIHAAGWTPAQLLIGTPHGWQARAPEDGRRVWEQSSLAESAPVLPTAGSVDDSVWPALFDIDRGLRIFDPDNGVPIASCRPPGRLNRILGIHATSVLMQTTKPTRTWRASAASLRDPWTIEEVSAGGEPWQSPPFCLANHVVGISGDHRLFGLELGNQDPAPAREALSSRVDGEPERKTRNWAYRNFSFGQAGPFAWPQQGELLVTIDGSLLASFDPGTGNKKWSTGLADFPLQSPARQACPCDDAVVATSQGTIRRISIKDGSLCWERYLGDTSLQWRTVVAWNGAPDRRVTEARSDSPSAAGRKALLAVWPLDLSGDADRAVLFCDAETGVITQRLRVDAEPKELMLNPAGHGILWTDKSITGLRPSSTNAVATSSLKAGVSRP